MTRRNERITKRERQKFTGTLTDRELYMIEDGLKLLQATGTDTEQLIIKLYSEFSETK